MATDALAPPAVACAHCGIPVPADALDAAAPRQFCCAGCRAVWTLLAEHGLDDYYAVRDATDAPGRPARPSGRAYAELDTESFRARGCRAITGGLLATDLVLEGVHCGACVWLVERLPALVPGVVEARLDLPRSQALITWDPRRVSLSAIARRLDGIGYTPHPCRGGAAREARRHEDRAMVIRIGVTGAVAAAVMHIALALYGGALDGIEPEAETFLRWMSLVITLPAVVWGADVFFRGAVAALRVGVLHMDLPISAGIVAGFVHGAVNTVRGKGDVYFDSVTCLIFLLLVGRHVLRRQQRAAADRTELLASLAPATARLIEDGAVREIPLDALVPGARVEVRADDTIPADGVIVAGRSALDLSLLSGESRPVEVAEGDRVHAGTVNRTSRIEVRVERTGEDTRVGQLMKLVDEHARRRAPIVALADRIAGWFVAVVFALAAGTFLFWLPAGAGRAIDHAVALLVVTCPCALGLATPLALSAAMGRAARAGILVKGADVLQTLTRPGRIWLDKTGTLTEGRLTLVRWVGDESAKPLVAALETHSAHPVARALVAALGSRSGSPATSRETRGGGITGVVDGRRVAVGSPSFVASETGPVPASLVADAERCAAEGLTPLLVAVDGSAVAVAALGDAPREDAAAAVARIARRGWEIGVLSGDHPAAVESAARKIGLDPAACRGGVTPEGKLERVTEERERRAVVMVGDGVNDAAALAAATVGIAVHGGAEAALAAADVYVVRPGLAPVADLIDGAGRAMRVVRRNLVFSLLYNVAGAALAMAGLVGPLVAAVLMPVSSLIVVASSYRARTFDREPAR